MYDERYIQDLCESGLRCPLVLIMSFFYQNTSSNVSRLLIGNKIDADPDKIIVTTSIGNNVSHAFFLFAKNVASLYLIREVWLH